jgi:hypothetical protein
VCRSSSKRPKEWERNLNAYDKRTHRIPGEADRPECTVATSAPSTEEEWLPRLNCKAPDNQLKMRCERCTNMIVRAHADSSCCHQEVSLRGERRNDHASCLSGIANMCTRNNLAPFGGNQRGESGTITVANPSISSAAE